MQDARAIQTQTFADLNYPNKKQYAVFPSYVCMAGLAEQWGCKNVLEIGAGSSTAVWARFAQRTGANVCTIDADPGRLKGYLRNTRHEAAVSAHIEFVEGTTIHRSDFTNFHNGDPRPMFGSVAVAKCMDYLDVFQSRNCSLRRWHGARKMAGHWNWSARELLTSESSLHLPRPLLDMYSSKRNFDNEIAFLDAVESQGKSGHIDKLVSEGRSWDLIFFDSGELSSMIEWTMLKNHITIGGFAAFHDIFFPKSIKNILPCAAVMADPDWELTFFDDSSKQGLLIAKRLK
jgi:hypothetical protein